MSVYYHLRMHQELPRPNVMCDISCELFDLLQSLRFVSHMALCYLHDDERHELSLSLSLHSSAAPTIGVSETSCLA